MSPGHHALHLYQAQPAGRRPNSGLPGGIISPSWLGVAKDPPGGAEGSYSRQGGLIIPAQPAATAVLKWTTDQ